MNARKYLSLEDAAHLLGIHKEELVRLRERGAIRGFADRGTWKFKAEDIEEYKRSRQADSDPEVPLILDDDRSVLGGEDDVGDQPTVVRGPRSSSALSDSDVRLILDDSLAGPSDSDPEVAISGQGESDSDVSLVDEPSQLVDDGSDSDVKLVGSDTVEDVSLSGSDSDVKLVGSDSDSDVSLADEPAEKKGAAGSVPVGSESDSDVALAGTVHYVDPGSDSDVKLVPPNSESEILLSAEDEKEDWEVRSDSDVRLVADKTSGPASDSDVNLVSADDELAMAGANQAGSVLEEPGGLDDSGIALELVDSGIALDDAADSGISLASAADSGIALEDLADSGIALVDEGDDDSTYALVADSGVDLKQSKGQDELGGTVPMVDVGDEDDAADTAMEVPTLDDEDSEYRMAAAGDTSEMHFDDDESSEMVKAGRGRGSETIEAEAFDFDEGDEFGEVEDFDEDLEVPEDILGEDEDVDEGDVFGAGDEDFEPAFESGESHAEFLAPVGVRGGAVAVEQEWGAGAFAGLALSTVLMVLCALLMFDLIRTMWAYQEPYAVNSFLLKTIGGMF